jgi:transposase
LGQELELMSQKEAARLAAVRQVLDGRMSQAQAAQALGLSVRQVKRLCRRVRQQGAPGLISQRRGRPSNRRIAPGQREHYVALVRRHYAGFGAQLAREYLAREHGYPYSTETLRGWMIQAGLWVPKARRAQRVHPARPRRACFGELVQVDGSHHDWFEGRSPKCCLTAFIDDATGRVLHARFAAQETTEGYSRCAPISTVSACTPPVRVEANDRKRVEQLCRYITRPALSDERVQLNAAGQVELKLKTPWRDGTTHLVMSPLEFMQQRIEWRLLGSQICKRYGSTGSAAPVRPIELLT